MDPATSAATVDALNQGINVISNIKNNRRNRKYAKEQYAQQRADALADWNRQNEYNSPQAQMERYKAAGLNPNLIYGNQSDGPVVRSTPMDIPESKASRVEGNIMGTYQDASLKQIQTNNMRQQADILQAQERLMEAQTLNTLMAADQKSLSNDKLRALWDNMLTGSALGLEAQGVDIKLKNQAFQQKEQMFPNLLAEKISVIAKNNSGIALNQYQMADIVQKIKQSKAITALTENKNLSETQHRQLVDQIMDSNVIKMKLDGQQWNMNNLNQDIRKIQLTNKEWRISDEALEHGIKEVLDLIPTKKFINVNKEQKNTYEKIKK